MKTLAQINVVSVAKLVLAAAIGGVTAWFWPENPVEKAAEEIIKEATGINVDIAEIEGSGSTPTE